MEFFERLRLKIREIDRLTVNLIQTHTNLIAAGIALGLCMWGLTAHHMSIVLGMVAIGAVSFFFGIALAMVAACGLFIFDLCHLGLSGFPVSVELVKLVGYICISWLGYRHKEQQTIQKQVSDAHPDQVVPWAVVNEVRTSLAAVRFLLFPLHDQHKGQDLQKVTSELSRLENIFTQLEQKERQRKP